MDILFIVHPSCAIDAWGSSKNIDKLRSFYNHVLYTIKSWQGMVITTLIEPWNLSSSDKKNKTEYVRFLSMIHETPAVVLHETRDDRDMLGSAAFDVLDGLANHRRSITFAGCFLNQCVKDTRDNLTKVYGDRLDGFGIFEDLTIVAESGQVMDESKKAA